MNHNKFKSLKIFFLAGILVPLFAAVLGYYFVLPHVIDLNKYKTQIKSVLENKIAYPVDFGDFNIKLTWNLRVRINIDKITIKKHDKSKFLNCGSSYVEIALPPLVNNRIILKKIYINTLNTNITRLKNGKFDIADILKRKKKPKYKVSFDNTKIFVNGYKINFQDNFINSPKKYLFMGEKIKVKDLKPNKFIKISALGKIVLKNKPAIGFDLSFSSTLPFAKQRNLAIKGNITNLDLNDFLPYINRISATKFISLQGKGNAKFNLELRNKLFGKNNFSIDSVFNGIKAETLKHGVISSYKDKLRLVCRGYYNERLLSFNKFLIKGNNIDIKGSGLIRNYKSPGKKKNFDINLNINNSKTITIAELFPKNVKVKRDPFKKILKYKVDGLIFGKFALKGSNKAPRMFGTINYKDLTIQGGFKNTPLNYGKVNFVSPFIIFQSKVFLDKNDFVNVKGKVAPFGKKTVNVDITSNEVDFTRAYNTLMVIKEFFRMKLGALLDMTFKGRGRANLNISGKTNNVKINGYVEANGAAVKYDTLSKPAENVHGKIQFVGKKVFYDELTGTVDGLKVIPSGYSTLNNYSDMTIRIPELDLKKGLEFVRTSPLLIQAQTALKDVLKAKGKADGIIYLKGSKEKMGSKGKFIANNADILYRGFGGWFRNLNGPLKFNNKDIYFEGITGNVKGNKVKISGAIKENYDAKLNIVSNSMNLASARTFLMNSFELKQLRKVLGEYTDIRGVSDVAVNINGNLKDLTKDPLQNLVFKNMNAVFNHKLTGIPIALNGGSLNITPNKVTAHNVSGISEGIDFTINGNVSNIENNLLKNEPLIPDFDLKINKFDLSKLKNFSKIPLIPEKTKKLLASFDKLHGYTELSLIAKPDSYDIKVIPDGISAVYTPYDTFVLIKSGELDISNNDLKFSSLKGILSESRFNLNGFINHYMKNQKFDLTLNTDINFNDVDKFSYYSNIPLQAGGIIPFFLSLKGNTANWKISGRMALEKGNYFTYVTDIGLPRNKVRLITLEAKGNKDKLNIDRLRIDLSNSADKQINVSNSDENYKEFKNLINIHGVIDKLKSKKPVFKDFIIKTNNKNSISTKLFNHSIESFLNNGCKNFFTSGNFKTNLVLNGYVTAPEIRGNTTFQDITIPGYKAYIKSINLNFDKNGINLDIKNFKIGESWMDINALLDTKLEVPVLVKNLKINSRMLNIDEISKIFSAGSNAKLSGLPAFVITNGSLNSRELVVRDLITSNIKARFTFTPDWLLSVSKVSFDGAGGSGTGNIYYNLSTNELSAGFNFDNMQANALATTLLTLPNEVYGTLSGNVQFSTRGKTPQELIANSNGYAEFEARKGRFVRLGSLEYFLRAVNVIQSGVGGFNINNIIDLIAPKQTGHFNTLRGRVYAKKGVLYADDITSSGKNLSLYLSGNIDMLTNKADIQVLGRLSKKITSLLGPIGSISINEFIDYIPGLGFLPATPGRKGIIDYIPGLSKIPGLELNNNQKYRRFAVQIKGNLYDQSSVKSFRWIE